jgi:type IV pilus assembly protein PilZ
LPDNRQYARKMIVADVAYRVGDGPLTEARCRDLSLGGMFIETPAPLPYGAALQLHLPLPGLRAGALITAVVRWSKPDGMGVQFGSMGARETHALTLLLGG